MVSVRHRKRNPVFGAYDVSKPKRLAQVCAAVLSCLLSSGIIFGYAALKPLMVNEGVYRDLCTENEIIKGVRVCYKQEIRLNLMFILSAITANICALPTGAILDKYGPRFTAGLGAVLIAMGSLLFASATHFPYDKHICGYLLLSMGGPAVLISSLHLSNSFPKHSSLILSILSGAFDGSTAVFLLFREFHSPKMTLKLLFLCYLVVPVLIIGCQIFLMQPNPYSTIGELLENAEIILMEETELNRARTVPGTDPNFAETSPKYRELIFQINSLLNNNDHTFIIHTQDVVVDSELRRMVNHGDPPAPHTQTPLWGTLHSLPTSQQITSPWFILFAMFAMGQFLRINYFMSTLRMQYEHLLSSPALAETLDHWFDYLLPICGVVAIPFISLILDYVALPSILLSLVTISTILGIIGCISPSITMGYISIILFTLYRPYFYHAASDYVAKIFGFQTFGKVYGIIIFVASMGSLFQMPLEMITFNDFNGNPIPVNIVLTAGTSLVGGALVSFVWYKSTTYCCPPLQAVDSFNNSRTTRNQPASTGDDYAAVGREALQTDPLLRSFDEPGLPPSYGATANNVC